MSFNQSKGDKSESHYRKSGRSNNSGNQRNFSGSGGGKGGGGNAPPPQSSTTNPSLSTNRSFKKSSNGQGGQSRVSAPNTNPQLNVSAPRGQNGTHVQHPLPGDATAPVVKPTNPPIARSTRPVPPPKAPSSQSTSGVADSVAPSTPAKAEMNKSFQLQFGTISPGVVNGMQIPARTSSAPPNLDEQKRDQARYDSFRAVPTMPIPIASKQPQSVKDVGSSKQSTAWESHASSSPVKRDGPQVLAAPGTNTTQKSSVLPLPQYSVQMPFPPQVSVPFGAPNSQIQPQNITSTPHQMQIPLSVGSAGSQQVFVPTLQSHTVQAQGMIPQGQNLNFTTQVNHQMPPQMGNIGMGISPQFSQQQALKFGGIRKTVKITHPDTHEELRLDKSGSSGARSHPNAPSQSQPMPSYAPHHISYYPPMQTSSYNPTIYYPTPQSAVSLTSTQMTTGPQATRYNYSIGQVQPTISIKNPSAPNLPPAAKNGPAELLTVQHPHDAHAGMGSVSVTTKPTIVSHGEKVGTSSVTVSSPVVSKGESPKLSSVTVSSPVVSKGDSPKLSNVPKEASTIHPHSTTSSGPVSGKSQSTLTPSTSTPPSEESAPAITVTDNRQKETISRSESFKDCQKKVGKKDAKIAQLQNQEKVSDPPSISKTSAGNSAEALPLLNTAEGLLGSSGEPLPDARVSSDASESVTDATICEKVNVETVTQSEGTILESQNVPQDVKQDVALELKQESIRNGEGKIESHEGTKQDTQESEVHTESTSSGLSEENKQAGVDLDTKEIPPSSSDSHGSETIGSEAVNLPDNVDSVDAQTVPSEETASVDTSACSSDRVDSQDVHVSSSTSHQEPSSDSATEAKGTKTTEGDLVPMCSKDKPTFDTNRVKSSSAKGRKKMKDILKAADAAGSTSDLYMAYKGPEEKQDNAENISNSSNIDVKQQLVDGAKTDAEEDGQTKAEPDDWEDAADLSTPKLKGKQGGVSNNDDGKSGKKYSRDFLLTLSEQCTDLPADFEIGSDIAESLMSAQVGVSHLVEREMYPSAGRNDRPGSGPRPGRGGGIVHDDKWNKSPGSYGPGQGGQGNFRPVQGGNPRNPRGGQTGGILGGPGMQRTNSDADRWQHKGLIPSPQTPAQIMHKAERKYEIRKVSDIEEAKQRQLKAILNKLTPQNFDKLFEQVKEVNIDNAVTLSGVISQIFDKALMEPTFCEMYANFCSHLADELPDFSEDNEKITFKRLLLNKCQEEFERGEREQAEANRADEEGEVKCSAAEREEKRIQVRRRMLGNIRLIGELYKERMLTERIMHECIKKLLGEHQNPDEEDVEALCKLMSTIGEMIDHAKAKTHMDAYFEIMTQFSNNMKLSSRVRFMLKDSIDLRRNKWQQRRKIEGPKKIDEVHRDAAQERHAQATRLNRGPSFGQTSRRGQQMEYGPPRGMSSPNSQMGGPSRGGYSSSQGRYGQDVRMDERQQQQHSSYESRTLSVPLSQRPMDDGPITLGPQGGLARGMSVRGQPMMPGGGPPLVDIPPLGDPRRFIASPNNGYNSPSEWSPSPYQREEATPRYGPDSRSMPMPPSSTYMNNRDYRSVDRPMDNRTTTPPVASVAPHTSPEKVFSEDRLRDMSISTIREFYSIKDKNEVALCIRELNAPSFYPSLVSLWVSDSFERKDMERDLLAKLLVELTKPRDSVLNSVDLIKGFESVLATLEDAVNDAPRAAEFLGRILAKVIVENVVQLRDVGRIIQEGGEEPGLLKEAGLAGDVLGSVLETIRLEKGDSGLGEILKGSNLRLDDFRPPDPIKSKKLEAFL